jgi:hypothetical protein
MSTGPLLRRTLLEDLLRRRRASDPVRLASALRLGQVDPNPHQLDAVRFALERLPEGGCILADEVGLGKTIEAAMVVAQRRLEGAQRVLIVAPKALLGQWRQELFTLFGLHAVEHRTGHDLSAPQILLVSRDFAGGERGSALLAAAPAFDLCVIDEAHEVFAGLHRRYDRQGIYDAGSPHAKMAGRVAGLLRGVPVLLLTATPMQNTLTELWALTQYVEPSGALLGDLPTFRALFCGADDRTLADGLDGELRGRVAQVCKRTLRRQAQPFMERPFVERRAKLLEYTMSDEERALYNDVSTYLLEPGTSAFRGNYRRLLLLGFHRRMASSMAALASSLERVAERLEMQLQGFDPAALGDGDRAALGDLEEETAPAASDSDEGPAPNPTLVAAELERVRGYAERARNLSVDGKAAALVSAVRMAMARETTGEGSGKLVVFTESLSTQAYLREVLLAEGFADEEITLFRGTNDSARAAAALATWQAEVAPGLASQPSADIAVRLALVHEFRTRSRVFVSTEAGAKGLNLQFADTLINYDLPWNPQRIEQRIGRVHRYGQRHDVTIVNFLARDNEAQRLTYQILSHKLDLFGTVLDASDVVLHEPGGGASDTIASALAGDFEASVRRIYERARSVEEIEEDLAALARDMDEKRSTYTATQTGTAARVQAQVDEAVATRLGALRDGLEGMMAAFDSAVARVAGEAVSLSDPRFHKAAEQARALPAGLRLSCPADAPPQLRALVGQTGWARLVRVRYRAFEVHDVLLPLAVVGETTLDADQALALFAWSGSAAEVAAPDRAAVDDAAEEAVFWAEDGEASVEEARARNASWRVEREVADRVLLLDREREERQRRLTEARERRASAIGADARTRAEDQVSDCLSRYDQTVARIGRLEQRDDRRYRRARSDIDARRGRVREVQTLFDVAIEVVP